MTPRAPTSRISDRFERLLERLGCFQTQRPWGILSLVSLVLVPCLWSATQLSLHSELAELLPENKPSVVELERVRSRVSGSSTLILVLEQSHSESLAAVISAIGPKIAALGSDLVAGVDDGPSRLFEFVDEHRALYAPLSDLERLRDNLREAIADRTLTAAGMGLQLDESEDERRPDWSQQEAAWGERLQAVRRKLPGGKSGYYLSDDGSLGAIVIRSPLQAGDPMVTALKDRIQRIVEGYCADARLDSPQVAFTGSLITSIEEHAAVARDLSQVGIVGVALVLASVLGFFLSRRSAVVLAAGVGVGCVNTFALVSAAIGHLNTASGFMTSILVGNGINFGIVLMARWSEARLRGQLSGERAIVVAMCGTFRGTLAAATCAAVAYGSLVFTDFRGFRHFGFMGAAGMLLCWIATYVVVPPLLILFERWRPISAATGWRGRLQASYGRPFGVVVGRYPRLVLAVSVACGFISVGLTARYLLRGPMEQNLANLRNDAVPGAARELGRRVASITGSFSRDRYAIALDRSDDVPFVVSELERRRDVDSKDAKPFERVVSILDVLPSKQAEKIKVLGQIRELIDRARLLGGHTDPTLERLDRLLPTVPRALSVQELPEEIAWPFIERDGSRGRLIYVTPTDGQSLNDARYLERLARAIRQIALPDGRIIRGSGDPVVYADLIANVAEDAPVAMTASVFLTGIIILSVFGPTRYAGIALCNIGLGLLLLGGVLELTKTKLNFLNFIALPITVGVGADYCVNFLKRLEQDGIGRVRHVLLETGGAIALCSLTTILGYGALLFSANGAVRSFGLVAAAGEVAMLTVAILATPAWLLLKSRPSHATGLPIGQKRRARSPRPSNLALRLRSRYRV